MTRDRVTAAPPSARRIAAAALADTVAVLAFAAAGRRSHGQTGDVIGGTLSVAAPFLIALAVAWVVVRAWRRPTAPVTGLAIWPLTVVLGMVLRNQVFDRGTATSFVIVASAVTGALLLGWRLLYRIRSCS